MNVALNDLLHRAIFILTSIRPRSFVIRFAGVAGHAPRVIVNVCFALPQATPGTGVSLEIHPVRRKTSAVNSLLFSTGVNPRGARIINSRSLLSAARFARGGLLCAHARTSYRLIFRLMNKNTYVAALHARSAAQQRCPQLTARARKYGKRIFDPRGLLAAFSLTRKFSPSCAAPSPPLPSPPLSLSLSPLR